MIAHQSQSRGPWRCQCKHKIHLNFKDPRIKHPGVFVFIKEKMEQIDYEKLNERIVEQAYETAFGEMTQEQLQKLIQDKFERARIYREALEKSPTFNVN